MPSGTERRIIVIGLVGAFVYAVIFKDGVIGSLVNLMFLVAGYYFGNGKVPRNGEG